MKRQIALFSFQNNLIVIELEYLVLLMVGSSKFFVDIEIKVDIEVIHKMP